ncbi:hypothetical protein P3X46_003667 [Hevea brasiliensis]|uniref:WRKY domain-containing protein n=1 Tax=Hevea brasiliensis TaxID=3981 RepID=A0ABQ9N6Z3_HEVBR|nr:probable WRKY transcription factor 53 [Hevea brasiliensis]KAJ9188297.1 hypothetical protein P3X46_003667 [Hevea brasiliensis]
MEKAMDGEQKTLIAELTQGKELAEQLRKHLNSISSPETRQFLVEKILSSYEKALSMLNWGPCAVEIKPTISTLESPYYYANSSPRSDVSDQDCKDHYQKNVFKKRKTEPRWTEQVKACSGTGLEGPHVDDGYSWRKYGQKDILGANFPRGYYRCTHRHSQGCLATKQVQRSDQDPTIFEITYRGRHTCFKASRLAVASASLINAKCSKQGKDGCQLEQPEQKPKPLKEYSSFNFREGLKSQECETVDDIFPFFSFPDASSGNGDEGNDIFKESMMENDFLGSLSPAFISPATSDSSHLVMSRCHMNGIDHNVKTPESNSPTTSTTNSSIGDWDISLDNVDFDNDFPFDNPELFA